MGNKTEKEKKDRCPSCGSENLEPKGLYKCTKCSSSFPADDEDGSIIDLLVCPNCGAKEKDMKLYVGPHCSDCGKWDETRMTDVELMDEILAEHDPY